jgi:hypothetical protein
MVTAAQLRRLALALPETEEKSHFEQPDFRVRNKIFAGLSQDGAVGVLKLTTEIQAMVIDAKPKVFWPASGAWGRAGWTHFQLAQAELGALETLLREAWQLVAPKRLAAAHSGSTRSVARQDKPAGSARRKPAKPAKRRPSSLR